MGGGLRKVILWRCHSHRKTGRLQFVVSFIFYFLHFGLFVCPLRIVDAMTCTVDIFLMSVSCTCSQAHQMWALILLWRFRSDTPYSVNRALVSNPCFGMGLVWNCIQRDGKQWTARSHIESVGGGGGGKLMCLVRVKKLTHEPDIFLSSKTRDC